MTNATTPVRQSPNRRPPPSKHLPRLARAIRKAEIARQAPAAPGDAVRAALARRVSYYEQRLTLDEFRLTHDSIGESWDLYKCVAQEASKVELAASEFHDTARTPVEWARVHVLTEIAMRMWARLDAFAREISAHSERLRARMERYTDTWERPIYVRDHARASAGGQIVCRRPRVRHSHRAVHVVAKTAGGDSGDPDPDSEPPTRRRRPSREVAP